MTMTLYELNYILESLRAYLGDISTRKDFSSFEYEQCLVAIRAVEKLVMIMGGQNESKV